MVPAACIGSSLLEGQNFGVLQAVECVEAFSNKLSIAVCNDRTNTGSGRSETTAAARKFYCAAHEVIVLCRKCHDLQDGGPQLIGGEQ